LRISFVVHANDRHLLGAACHRALKDRVGSPNGEAKRARGRLALCDVRRE
jgi:hypothetical protein